MCNILQVVNEVYRGLIEAVTTTKDTQHTLQADKGG